MGDQAGGGGLLGQNMQAQTQAVFDRLRPHVDWLCRPLDLNNMPADIAPSALRAVQRLQSRTEDQLSVLLDRWAETTAVALGVQPAALLHAAAALLLCNLMSSTSDLFLP